MEAHSDNKKVSLVFAILILLFPYLFAWFTLRKGYSNNAKILSFGWLIFVLWTLNARTTSNTASVNNNATAQASSVSSSPYNMPLQYSQEVQALDGINATEMLRKLLAEKNSRIKLFDFIRDNEDAMGVNCSHNVCYSVRSAFRRLEDFVKNPNDLDAYRDAQITLEQTRFEVETHKKSTVYQITKQKPLFVTQDGIYTIENNFTSREQCKLLGDALHLTKKKALIVFVNPGKKISRKVANSDLDNINCIYRYNYGGKKFTQVLIGHEIKENWN